MSLITKKICIIGNFGVGKTSLISRFVERQFNDQYLSTVGVKISKKMLELPLKSKLIAQLVIWDVAGSNKFKSITPTYLQGASGAIVVADITRQETMTEITDHVQLFLSVNPKSSLVVALNKSDLANEANIAKISSATQIKNNEKVLATYLTSAKTGLYVDEMFHNLAYNIMEKNINC